MAYYWNYFSIIFQYEPESAFETLLEWAYASMIQGGSSYEFSSALTKVASMEGIYFQNTIDEAGSIDAMRAAAGLPEVAEKR